MLKKAKYHHWFWVFSILYLALVFVSKFIDYNTVLDINLHDTYYIVDYSQIQIITSLVFFLIGCIYWSFFKLKIPLIDSLSKIHTYITIGSVLILFLIRFITFTNSETPNFPLYDKNPNHQLITILLSMLIATSQLIFILNLIISTIKFSVQSK